jgi:3,4-dihydroxy 2-butanone 4-phosphate synthase/GTP cyclohydrolase II
MCAIERAGAGIIIYLRQEGRGIGLVNKLKAYKLQEQGLDTFEANKKLGFVEDGRDYWVAAQILKHFGVESVRLLSNNPEKEDELKEYGVYISERLSLESMPTRHNLKYLQAKHEKMGHVMDIKEKLIFS